MASVRSWGAAAAAGLAMLVLLAGPPAPAFADSTRAGQWQLTALHATSAWRYSTGTGVVVAVLDSGVDARHPDLVGQVLPGMDFVDGSTDGRTDPVGHGTTVAALIAGRADDKSGVEGLAPAAKILPVRVLDKQNKYSDATTVARGVRWAVDHGASVINMSLGGAGRSSDLASAIAYAAAHDVVVVACTGNTVAGGDNSQVWYPAREPGVIAVAGLAEGKGGASSPMTRWQDSLVGPETVLSAPAATLLGARPGGYWHVAGTSFAAPLVSATAALVRAKWPTLDAAEVINRLITTAADLGPAGRDNQYGFGRVDPVAALTRQVPDVTSNPLLPAIATPTTGTTGQVPGGGGPVPTSGRIDLAAASAYRRWVWSLGTGSVTFVGLLTIGLWWVRRSEAARALPRPRMEPDAPRRVTRAVVDVPAEPAGLRPGG